MTELIWIKAANEGDIEDEDAICMEHNGKKIAVFFVDNIYYATDNQCTHEIADLCDGFLDGATIECPLHQAVFCLKTGKALAAPAEEPVRTYPVKVEDGAIYIQV